MGKKAQLPQPDIILEDVRKGQQREGFTAACSNHPDQQDQQDQQDQHTLTTPGSQNGYTVQNTPPIEVPAVSTFEF
jgi:hypothetical protein